jgi:uncharacterized protein YjbJ (UPF0337 family)
LISWGFITSDHSRRGAMLARANREDRVMDKNRIVGSAKQIKGSLKETVGKVVGDAKLQIDGKADQAEGKIQNVVGTIKDSLKP